MRMRTAHWGTILARKAEGQIIQNSAFRASHIQISSKLLQKYVFQLWVWCFLVLVDTKISNQLTNYYQLTVLINRGCHGTCCWGLFMFPWFTEWPWKVSMRLSDSVSSLKCELADFKWRALTSYIGYLGSSTGAGCCSVQLYVMKVSWFSESLIVKEPTVADFAVVLLKYWVLL